MRARQPEQLRIPVEPFETRACQWKHRGDNLVKSVDDPAFCQYVAEKGGKLCQKHTILAKRFNINISEGDQF